MRLQVALELVPIDTLWFPYFLSQVTFSSLESGLAESSRRKASTCLLFSQHPGREALIEPLSRMPREIPWKPACTLAQLIKQSRGFFSGSEIIREPGPWNGAGNVELETQPIRSRPD
jgi:hypothetical protein